METESSQEEAGATQEGNAKSVAEMAELELKELIGRQAAIAGRIQVLKRVLSGLGQVFGDKVLSENVLRLLNHRAGGRRPGLTNACRQVVLQAKGPLRAAEIREHLIRIAPGILERHKDPIASVTTIMGRLCAYGEARAVVTSNGHKAWESSGIVPDEQRDSNSESE